MNNLGQLIKQYRKNNKWSQKKFAKMLGVHKNNVYYWENSIHQPESKKLIEILKILKIGIDEIMTTQN